MLPYALLLFLFFQPCFHLNAVRVPKQLFVCYSELQNISCPQTAIRLFTAKFKILKTVPKLPFIL